MNNIQKTTKYVCIILVSFIFIFSFGIIYLAEEAEDQDEAKCVQYFKENIPTLEIGNIALEGFKIDFQVIDLNNITVDFLEYQASIKYYYLDNNNSFHSVNPIFILESWNPSFIELNYTTRILGIGLYPNSSLIISNISLEFSETNFTYYFKEFQWKNVLVKEILSFYLQINFYLEIPVQEVREFLN
ncbi:MAG: hypothetical protein A2V66_15575 [Ignavibacteria bacterium RBG_13_36_8]|nr:MAG: hypothetical protein A2V66_15575 [Ignavibacteria bacterium RBG_13_36_8]